LEPAEGDLGPLSQRLRGHLVVARQRGITSKTGSWITSSLMVNTFGGGLKRASKPTMEPG
jgi:hypothetical protein